MLYTDDEIIEYEYEIVDDVEWKDDNTESAKTMVVIERDIEKINSVEIEEVTSTDNDIKEIEYVDESIKR